MGAVKEVLVPDIGDFSDVPVIEVMVKPGDRVRPEDSLIVLESDKATLDVPAPFGGAVRTLKVQVGDRVSEGTAILELEAEDVDFEAATPAVTAPAEPAPDAAAVPAAERASDVGPPPSLPHASPAIRRFARELGVDLGHVHGTGPSRRIVKEDVQTFVRAVLSRTAPTAVRPATMPTQATHFDEADVTGLEAFRAEVAAAGAEPGTAMTLTPFVLTAVVAALKRFPSLNASLDGETPVPRPCFHLAFAVDTPNGCVAPVIRDVDRKGVIDLAREIGLLTDQARDDRLEPASLPQPSFIVVSTDAGGTGFTPVMHGAAIAILGVTRAQPRLRERDGSVMTRLMLPLCLSYDSEVIDSTTAARFTACVADVLGDLRRASL